MRMVYMVCYLYLISKTFDIFNTEIRSECIYLNETLIEQSVFIGNCRVSVYRKR